MKSCFSGAPKPSRHFILQTANGCKLPTNSVRYPVDNNVHNSRNPHGHWLCGRCPANQQRAASGSAQRPWGLASWLYFWQTAWLGCRGMPLGIVGRRGQFWWPAMKKGAHRAFFIILPVLTGLASFRPRYCTRRSMVMFSTSTRRFGSRHLISAGSCLSVQVTTGSASPLPCAFRRAASTPLLAR